MAKANIITRKELKSLPILTLEKFATAAARDIDEGQDDKRPLLETIFKALEEKR